MPSFKLINAVVFFLIIWGTQCLVNAEKPVSFEQHVQVQQELSQLIAAYIQENLPQMTNFKMHSIYTKPPKKGLLEAYFNYSFTTTVENSAQLATTELEGIAVLRKIKDEPQEWALEKIEIEGESLTFTEPVVITPSKDGQEAKPVEVAPKVETPKPAVTAPPLESMSRDTPLLDPTSKPEETSPEAHQ